MTTPTVSRRWLPPIPDILWGSLAAASLMIVIGAFGILTNNPLLFPSLGPTAFLQTENPEVRMASFYNTVVGHLIGLGSGIFAVLVLHANQTPSVMGTGQIVPARVFAAGLAIAMTIVIGLFFHASHPPASATTLLVALGGFRLNLQTMLVVVTGVLLIAVLGEGLRRARMRQFRKPAS